MAATVFLPMDHFSQVVHRLNAELFPARRRTQLMKTARRYIDRCYDQGIELPDMAARACLSEHHFIRQFQQHYGKTPGQYLRSVRIARAKELIMRGWRVTDVCLAVGYSSPASFSLLFTRMTGTTPTHYRKAILDKRARDSIPIIDCWRMNAARSARP